LSGFLLGVRFAEGWQASGWVCGCVGMVFNHEEPSGDSVGAVFGMVNKHAGLWLLIMGVVE
jgi:hypothetical protein